VQAIYPQPKTTANGQGHRITPYLLRVLEVVQSNQGWSADITYLPMQRWPARLCG
jgi:putative transposase